MNNKKKTIKVIFCIAVVLLMFFILYRMFRDSYEDIVDSLSKTNMYIFAGMVLFSIIAVFWSFSIMVVYPPFLNFAAPLRRGTGE